MVDYSLLDQPQILQFMFYPRRDWTAPPPGASDHLIAVEQAISVSCRFYPVAESSPSILFFHGNGEVACDYDLVASIYNREGINLFVADYRGYGLSGGQPTFSSMAADACPIFDYFRHMLQSSSYSSPIFVMGRSLGSHSALELAAHYPKDIKGLVIESGFANPKPLLSRLSPSPASPRLEDFERASMERIHSITLPILIIHGECDTLVPPSQSLFLYQNIGSKEKRLETIPEADHNDILLVGMEQYFSAIREFVSS